MRLCCSQTPEVSFSREEAQLVYRLLIYKCTVKPVLSGHSKRRPKCVFKTDYRLMQVKSIAECSKGEHSAILLTFIKLSFAIRTFVLSIFETCYSVRSDFVTWYNIILKTCVRLISMRIIPPSDSRYLSCGHLRIWINTAFRYSSVISVFQHFLHKKK